MFRTNPLFQNNFNSNLRHKKNEREKLDLTMFLSLFLWALRDSNPRPSACKADALNQLS